MTAYELRISDWQTCALPIYPEIIEPWSWKQEIFNQVADARVMNADGKTLEPLVTITEDDLREFAVEGVPQVGRIALREFKETGIYHIPREPGDNHGYVYLNEFRATPGMILLPTPIAKHQITSQIFSY